MSVLQRGIMKIQLDISDDFLKELKIDMAAGVLASAFTGELTAETKLSICILGAARGEGVKEITRDGEVLVSARYEEL